MPVRHLLVLTCLTLGTVLSGCAAASGNRAAETQPSPSVEVIATPAPAELTPLPDDTAKVPEATAKGVKIRKLFDTGGGFVRLVLDPLTHDLHYLDGKANIYRLTISASGETKQTQVYSFSDVGGADAATGMAFGPDGTLYVAGNHSEDKNTTAIIRKGVPDASGKRVWSTLASTVPYPKSGTPFDHVVNGIAVSPDGHNVYFNSGSRTDHGEVESNEGAFPNTREVPLTSAIFRVPANAHDLVLPDDDAALKTKGYLFADGTRNSYDLEFAPNGDLFAGDNGPDADYPDEINWLRERHHYGFPWRFGDQANAQAAHDYDPSKDRRLQKGFFAVDKGTYANDLTFPQAPTTFTDPVLNLGPDADRYRGDDGKEQDASNEGKKLSTVTAHRSPLGLSFDRDKALPAPFKGDAFLLSYGAAGGTLTDRGEDLLDLKLSRSDDNYQATVKQIARKFNHPIDSVLLKNKLYVLDFAGAGTIWEVSFQ